ncbi:MAG: hypothetical protein U9N04_00430 [Patescibacteria group bacterium]|nr:hypothetical protein [Patescibacteria group bacterium]
MNLKNINEKVIITNIIIITTQKPEGDSTKGIPLKTLLDDPTVKKIK